MTLSLFHPLAACVRFDFRIKIIYRNIFERPFKTLNRMFMEETIMTVQNSVLLFYYIIMIFWPFTPTAFRSGKFNSSNMHVKSTPPSNIFILFKRTIVQLYILYTSFSKHL